MIRIQTDIGDLDLSPGTSIEFNLNSPLFEVEGLVKGDYSLDFTAPFSPKNAAIMGRPEVLENARAMPPAIKVKLYLENTPWLTGLIKVKNITRSGYNIGFKAGLSTIGDDIKEKSLREIVDQEYIVPVAIAEKFVTLQYTGATTSGTVVRMQVGDKKYERTIGSNGLSEVLQLHATFITSDLELSATYISPDKIKLVQLGPFRIERDMQIEGDGFEVYESFMDSYNAQYAAWLNQYFTETPPDDFIKFPKIQNKEFIQQLRSGILNPGEVTEGNIPQMVPDLRNVLSDYAPYPRLFFVLQKIEEALNIKFEGDFMDDPEMANLLLHHPESISIVRKFIGKEPFILWRNKFNIGQMLPDIKVNDFLKYLARFFNLSFDYNPRRRTVTLMKKEVIIKSKKYRDITHLCSPFDDSDPNLLPGITLRSKNDAAPDNELPAEDNPYEPLVVGDGSHPIETEMAGLSQLPGLLAIKHPKGANIMPKLMFYDAATNTASISSESYSLGWHGEKGMYEKWWKSWVRFEMRKVPVKLKTEFGIADIINNTWPLKYRIDRVNFLIKNIRMVAIMKGLKVADVEAYKA